MRPKSRRAYALALAAHLASLGSRLRAAAACAGALQQRSADLGQLVVGFFFLVERRLHQVGNILLSEMLGDGSHGAVRGDLVMLGALRGAHQRSEEHTSELQFT